LDPAVDRAVLSATLELLGEHGYEGLRVADVAARAGAGLGSLYRRWPTKRALVLAAFRSLTPEAAADPGANPRSELLGALTEISSALVGPEARVLMSLLAGPDRELADALRTVKLEPQLARLRTALQAMLGDVPDLESRVLLGPALITFHTLVLGHTISDHELRQEILPHILRPG